MDPTNKDSVKENVSVWISELGEIDATFKRSDIARLKSFIQKQEDTLRSPYAKTFSTFHRRTIFCGSVNQQDILRDDTGNSRWWCIPVKRIHAMDADDMQQMWAEVYARCYRSEDAAQRNWWLTADEERRLDAQNGSFEVADKVEDALARGLVWEQDNVSMWQEHTLIEILAACGIDRPTTSDYSRAGHFLRKRIPREPIRRHGGRWYLVPPFASLPGQYGGYH